MKATKACCLLLLHPSHHRCPSTLILILPHNQQQWLPPPQLTITTAAVTTHSFLVQPLYICRARKWDSNAESFRTQNFDYGYNDGGDEDDESDDTVDQWDGVLEDYIDSIWIFKVFASYGWMLPFIIVSLLLATGPKAFLMALALPLGQSTFSFAIQRMWSERQKPKRKSKTKKRTGAGASRSVRWEKENRARNRDNRKVKMGYKSWVPQDQGSTDTSDKDVPNFGGWDELDKGIEFDLGLPRNSAQTTGRSNKRPSEEGSLSSRMTKSDTPLLLRLLIAVFPFLGSWTKML